MSKKITRKFSPVAQKAMDHYIGQSGRLNQLFDNELLVQGRQRAQTLFTEQGFPTLRDEAWQYTKLTDFVQNHFKVLQKNRVEHSDLHAFLPTYPVTKIVFIDGWFDEELSDDLAELPNGVTIESTRDVVEVPGGTERLFREEAEINKEPFGLLNSMLLADGFYLEVEKNVTLEEPLFVLYVQTQDEHISTIRNNVLVDANAELTLVEKYVSLSDVTACSNVVTEIDIAESARMKQVVVQQQNPSSYYFNNQYVTQGEKSSFNTFYAGLGAQLSRHQNHLTMNGEQIENQQNSACLARGKQIMDSRTDTQHTDVWGVSQQLHKFVLADEAIGVFNGMIYVDRKAQKTDGQMDNKNLLLSETSKMNTKPQLEIYADDVKCSHGSATGQINKDQIFYLQARGIPRAKAVEMITQAFLIEPAESISNTQIQKWVIALLAKQLSTEVIEKVSK